MSAIMAHPEGTLVEVKVQAGARRNEVRRENDRPLKIRVTQAPEKGKANQAVLELLAEVLGVRQSQVELISGHTSPQKRILIRGLSPEEVTRRLDELGNSRPNT